VGGGVSVGVGSVGGIGCMGSVGLFDMVERVPGRGAADTAIT
jgi:hypothetical protein